jgi:hypothetical protein
MRGEATAKTAEDAKETFFIRQRERVQGTINKINKCARGVLAGDFSSSMAWVQS